jgi:ATP-dependent DNA helicase RecG
MSNSASNSMEKRLNQPIQFLKGVGPNRAGVLEKLELRTAADVLFFFPRTYQDFTELHQINELENDQFASIVGVVDDIDQLISSEKKHVLYVLIKQDQNYLRCVWFGQPFMLEQFRLGQRLMVCGKVKLLGGRFQMNHPKVTRLEGTEDAEAQRRLLPVYPLTEGINQRLMREIVARVVEEYTPLVQEAFPDSLRDRYSICEIETAIRQIHNPRNQTEVATAQSRLVFQELFILQLALAMRRHRVQHASVSPPLELTPKIRARISGRMPFELTASQVQAFQEIAADMGRNFPMNRLLHGEVGAGKTVVAVCAMMLAVAHGYQAVMMAPTEILAQQHLQTVSRLLPNSRVRIARWTGGMKAAERKATAEAIATGEADLIIGTQAVVASHLKFHQLGLVIIDEQHKFGVRQRALLKQTGHDPHYLVMTATPIPRTISMTLFGDLDVSTLQRTSGIGQRVHTYLGQESNRIQWWDFFRKKLREGRQGFVIAPRVGNNQDDCEPESEVASVSSDEISEPHVASKRLSTAEQLFESLANGPLEEFRLDVLHGRQSTEEKESAMGKFVSGKTQVLVATSLVEVGIDVPNATLMTIESAECFGISQLHQLRGRVSRGQHPGYVCAFATRNDPDSNERLSAFASTSDGFELAEIDLRIRGPGNLFGAQQSGFPPLRIADLIRDTQVLYQAQQAARELIAQDPELNQPELSRLKQLVLSRYGKALEMGDVG